MVGVSAAHADAIGGAPFELGMVEWTSGAPAAGTPEADAYGVAQDWVGQQEWSAIQFPNALAVAVAERVDIWTQGKIDAGDTGVVALSVAKANATATGHRWRRGSVCQV